MIDLGLKYLKPVSSKIEDNYLIIEVEPINTELPECPYCNEKINIKKYGHSRVRYFRDIPRNNRFVKLALRKQNYKCKNCNKLFPENIPDLFNKNFTVRFKKYIIDKIIENEYFTPKRFALSNVKLAESLGVHEKTIRRFKKEVDEIFLKPYIEKEKVI